MSQHRVAAIRIGSDLTAAVEAALAQSGILDRLTRGARVALKPNFTYPYYRRGITTSPDVLRAVVGILKRFTDRIAVVETDGGYGAWRVQEAFEGHGMVQLAAETGIELVNLCEEPSEMIEFRARGRMHHIPLPRRLLHEVDLFITLPVPKIHSMTRLTLSLKNQWGCIPDTMRLRRHYVFDDAIVAIDRALKPAVLADGTYFLDHSGPMEGTLVEMGLIIGASGAPPFDRYVSELMGVSWRRVGHLRRAAVLGGMPQSLAEIDCNVLPAAVSTRRFTLRRTMRNWIALAGFRSRAITWLGYESWFGRTVLHGILYAIAGRPVRPKDADE